MEIEIEGVKLVFTGGAVEQCAKLFDEVGVVVAPEDWAYQLGANALIFMESYAEVPWYSRRSKHLFTPIRSIKNRTTGGMYDAVPMDGPAFTLGLQTVQKKNPADPTNKLRLKDLSHVYITTPEALKLPETYQLERLMEDAKEEMK